MQKIRTYHLDWIGMGVILILAVLLLWIKGTSNVQAPAATLPNIQLQGEYKIGDGEWKEIRQGEHISATHGDVTLRGNLMLVFPGEDELLEPVMDGTAITAYCDHINVRYLNPGMEPHIADIENSEIGESVCGVLWSVHDYQGSDTGSIEIILHNPHRFGNEDAVDEFLESMSVYGDREGNLFQNRINKQTSLAWIMGIIYMILSLVLLGVALFSSMIRIPYSRDMWLIGLLFLCAGLFFMVDTRRAFPLESIVMVKTVSRELAMMIYMLCLNSLCTIFLTGKRKLVGCIGIYVLGGVMIAIFLTSMTGRVYLYDMNLFWGVVLVIVDLILVGCLAAECFCTKGKRRILLGGGIIALLAAITDVISVYGGFYQTGLFSKVVFVFLSCIVIVLVLNVIPRNIRAGQREKELKAELQETRIKGMLSQIKPHYLFNSLTTIKHLCRKDPEEAAYAIDQFSMFLRGSMNVLKETGKITFEQEIRFVKNYLYLEEKRFGDRVKVKFDLDTSNFLLPAFSVQTIVENAVRHGISKKVDGGTVQIISRENDDYFIVSVIDDGNGFDTSMLSGDMKDHVGIDNTRNRLAMMCGGRMEVHSQPGEGTRVDIYVPKNERK